MTNLFMLAGETAATTAAAGQPQELTGFALFFSQYGMLIMLALLFVVMYFLMIRPQKKQQKEEQKMRNNLRVGDEITTIGGICGRVVNVKEDCIIIETGADRSKITVLKAAVSQNKTVHDANDIDDDDDDDDDED